MNRRWNEPFRKDVDPRSVVARHRNRLLAEADIVSVGLGFDRGHRTVIVVGVSSETVEAEALPSELEGVPVEVRVVGKLATEVSASEEDGESSGKK